LKGPKSFSVIDRPRRPDEFRSGRLFIDVGGLAASFNQRQTMNERPKQRTHHVTVEWDSKKMDELKDGFAEFLKLPHEQQISASKPIRNQKRNEGGTDYE